MTTALRETSVSEADTIKTYFLLGNYLFSSYNFNSFHKELWDWDWDWDKDWAANHPVPVPVPIQGEGQGKGMALIYRDA